MACRTEKQWRYVTEPALQRTAYQEERKRPHDGIRLKIEVTNKRGKAGEASSATRMTTSRQSSDSSRRPPNDGLMRRRWRFRRSHEDLQLLIAPHTDGWKGSSPPWP